MTAQDEGIVGMATNSATQGRSRSGQGLAGAVRSSAPQLFARYGLLLVWALLVAVFAAANGEVFMTVLTAQTIASTKAVVALLAMAALLPLVVGQFDLSITSQFGLAQALCAGLIVKQGLSPQAAILAVLGLGLVMGLLNGVLVTYAKINAFVTTLGTGTLFVGLTQWYTGGAQIIGVFPQWFTRAGRDAVGHVPMPLVYVGLIGVVIWVALEFTMWGRRAFATGGNPRAALLTGVNVNRITISTFCAAGVIASAAGILQVMILGAASPEVGSQFLLPAFAGVFLGAAVLRPGRFNLWGTLIAVYFLATGITGLQQLGAPFYIEQFFNGAALLLAVGVAQLTAAKRRQLSTTKDQE